MIYRFCRTFHKRLLIIYQDGTKTTYFRGRKLYGKSLKVPEGYRGIIVEKQEATKPQAPRHDEPETVDLEDDVPIGALKTRAGFDEMIVWGHESIAEASSDPYVRGVDEWMALAQQVGHGAHCKLLVGMVYCFHNDRLLMIVADTFV